MNGVTDETGLIGRQMIERSLSTAATAFREAVPG
jgi:hypothetical protein